MIGSIIASILIKKDIIRLKTIKTLKENNMRTLKTITKEEYIRDKVFCNRCGREIHSPYPDCTAHYFSADKKWGYGSSFDGETHSFDLCESCYSKIISDFKIPPTDTPTT